jgi:ribosomal protein L24E
VVIRGRKPGSALLLTLIVILGLTLEVAIISLVLIRGFGSEGLLAGQNILAKRAAEIAINRLRDKIMYDLNSASPSTILSNYGYGGGSAITNTALTVDNPDGGTSDTAIIDAWVDSRRGDLYHLIGRARYGTSDILVHRWTMMKACGGGTLFTILTGASYPGGRLSMNRKFMTSDGRVFIGEEASTGNFWTWAETTGLSTLISSGKYVGYASVAVSPVDGRVFFGDGGESNNPPGRFWTWHPSTGLTTIISSSANRDRPGSEAITIANDGRVYFGGYSNYLWTWKDGILSTIINGTYGHPGAGSMAVGPDGRLFFGEHNGKRFATWKDNGTATGALTALQTAGSNIHPGSWLSVKVAGDGRVFWGQESSTGNVYTWKEGEPTGGTAILPSNMTQPGNEQSMIAAQDGRVFFGEMKATSARYWTWKGGVLSTILTSGSYPGVMFGAVVDSTNRVYFGDASATGSLWSWKEGVGLSTIISGNGGKYAVDSSIAIAPDDRIFFGGQNKNFYTYKEGVGLSTIISGNTYNLGYQSTRVAPNGRVFFGEDTGTSPTGKFYTWKADTGLSVIVTGAKSPGKEAIDVSDNGYVFFAENASSAKAWVYRINDCNP